MQIILTWINDFCDAFYRNIIYKDRYMYIIDGLKTTIIIAVFATLLGVTLGVLVAIVKVNNAQTGKYKFFNFICNIYINIMRGTPVVVQLIIMYFVVFSSVRSVDGVTVSILTFGLNSGAYVAEIVRAGILAVDKGQTEAGRSLGLSQGKTMRLIILPQAIKNILPALGNEFITLLKETSIVGYVAVQDLTKAGDIIRSQTYEAFVPLITVAAIYLVMVLGLTALLGKFERRLAKSDNH